jgi:hypothetical protein
MARKYRPSNGTEGAIFMSHWCDRCKRDEAFQRDPINNDSCPIVAATMAYDVGDQSYPVEWVEDDDGPRCTAFEKKGA